MANRSNATINQTLNYLLAKINNLPPPPPIETLAQTLIAGNSAGSTDIDMNGNDIFDISTQKFSGGIDITDLITEAQITSNNGGQLLLECSSDLILNVNNDSIIQLTPSVLNITGEEVDINSNNGNMTLNTPNGNAVINSTGFQVTASDFVNITANNDTMTLTADDDITLTSIAMGVKINGGDGGGGNNDITLNTNSGISIGNIILNSAGSVDLYAQNSGMTLNALTDITIQSQSLGTINTNAPNSNSYGYALPICLNVFESGNWSYTLGGQVFQDVFAGSPIYIALPPQFFAETTTYASTRWQINFDMNCWNFANANDKGFAIYLSFVDNASNVYQSFLYNSGTPFCKWDNAPTFVGSNAQFKSINFCDYIDFGGLVSSNDSILQLQMNIAGDVVFNNVDFKIKLGFTRIQRI